MATETTSKKRKVPSWIKADIFIDLLKDLLPDFGNLKSFKVVPALGPGENYATVMLRIESEVELKDGKDKTVSFMIKTAHDSEKFREILKKQNMFETEYNMYKNVVSELEQIYRDIGIDVKFGPSIYTIEAPDNYILLEDLRPRGFKNANRLEGLDREHCEHVLRKMAQWHAATAVRVETKGPYSEALRKGFFIEEDLPIMKESKASFHKCLLQCMNSYDGYEHYIEQVRAMLPKMTEILYKRMSKIDSNEFNVLNHGDLWSNNIMFQHDAFGKIKETLFVDYQIPKYGTVAQDLIYFLISSARLDIKISKFDHLIQYYHHHLIENLKMLNYPKKIPALRDIHASIYKYGFYGLQVCTTLMCAVLLDPKEMEGFDNSFDDSDEGIKFKMIMYSNARYRKHMETILPWLLNRGALEY